MIEQLEEIWKSLDGIGWAIDPYIKRLLFAKEKEILNRVFISYDAGWYDPEKVGGGDFQSFTNIFNKLIPALNDKGFSQSDWNQLLIENPEQAFGLR